MKFLEKLRKHFIYSATTKPEHYIHVDNPKTLQDYRQVQYNNWCKTKGVYNGSYLPKNPDKLKEEGKKGWREITSPHDKTGLHRTFRRKSSGQIVDYHYKSPTRKGTIADEHYHWRVFTSIQEKRKDKSKLKNKDRYGNKCLEHSKESHLAPLDKDYDFK